MTFSDDERAELIAARSRTADMVGLLLDGLDVLPVSRALRRSRWRCRTR